MSRTTSVTHRLAGIARWVVGIGILVALIALFDPILLVLVVPGLLYWLGTS